MARRARKQVAKRSKKTAKKTAKKTQGPSARKQAATKKTTRRRPGIRVGEEERIALRRERVILATAGGASLRGHGAATTSGPPPASAARRHDDPPGPPKPYVRLRCPVYAHSQPVAPPGVPRRLWGLWSGPVHRRAGCRRTRLRRDATGTNGALASPSRAGLAPRGEGDLEVAALHPDAPGGLGRRHRAFDGRHPRRPAERRQLGAGDRAARPEDRATVIIGRTDR